MIEKTLGIYVHIPFCISKCPYCDFYSATDSTLVSKYTEAVTVHTEDYIRSTSGYDVDTVYIGGGTPTSIPVSKLDRIIDCLYDNFNIRNDAEVTVEANPATVKASSLRRLRRTGVNRLSMGLQSANENELKALGRIHTFDDFADSFVDARKAGINNINVDLMYGIPHQTKDSLMESLKRVCEFEPEHISLYNLKIEDGTPFSKVEKKSLDLPSEDAEWEMYVSAIEYLTENGWAQYEISNFARAGKQCLHNLRYWNCEEYLGFGPGAHSYFGGRRFAYKRDTEAYIKSVDDPASVPDILSEDYAINPSERLGEYVMLRMRLTEGIDTAAFATKFGVDFEKMFEKFLPLYVKNGFMTHKGRFYSFTAKGMYVSNYILSAMLDFKSNIIKGVADGTDK